MAAIVVPFRGVDAKRRLAPLPQETRSALSLAMLGDVLAACSVVGETIVVTDDAAAREVAVEHDARAVDDPGGGQNGAVAAAVAPLRERRTLVVNADVACVVPEDLRTLERAIPEGGLAVVAARDGTTNALGLDSATLFAPLYGPGSADRFRDHARRIGVEHVAAAIPNLADDVDSLDDLERVELRVGPRTLAVLAPPRAGRR